LICLHPLLLFKNDTFAIALIFLAALEGGGEE